MFERTLLERVLHAEDEVGIVRMGLDQQALKQSVLAHLQNMFNVRQGSVMTLPDYGLPDLNDVTNRHRDTFNEIRKSIRYSINQYEPRLKRIKVSHHPDEENPLTMRFEISAQLLLGEESKPITFETRYDGSGRVEGKG